MVWLYAGLGLFPALRTGIGHRDKKKKKKKKKKKLIQYSWGNMNKKVAHMRRKWSMR